MPFSALSDQLGETGNKIQDYLKSTAEYYKLRLFKSSMKFATSLINMLVLGSILLLFLAFVSVGVAMWLGTIMGGLRFGFFIVGGIYLIVFVLMYIFGRDHITRLLLTKFSELIIEDEEALASKSETEFLYNEENVSPEQIDYEKPETNG
ncbi:MAG: phage holin family protein [Marinirhabdus sp.]|nr:phage holin family protein [Marinirhabdus sp.]